MKRFAALILALMFFVLCGCSSTEELFSEFTYYVKHKIEKVEEFGEELTSTFTSEYADQYEIVTVEPAEINSSGLLAYNKLNKKQKQLYSVFVSAFESMQLKKINITDYVTKEKISDVYVAHRAVLCDRPDIFWSPKLYSVLTFKNAENVYIQFSDNNKESYFSTTKAEKEKMQAEIDAAVDTILTEVNKIDTAFEKELYIHDYLCEHITYDTDAAADIDNADAKSLSLYGALVKGSCVCEGYAKAFSFLCNKAGIPCNVVYGESEGVAHMWNIVNVDNQLYYVDVTFDDSSAVKTLHSYFNITKSQAEKDHIFHDAFSQNKKYESSQSINFFSDNCESTEYNYFIKNGLLITEDCEMAYAAILKEVEAGKKNAELMNVTNRSLEGAFKLLRRKLRNEIYLRYYYSLEDENMLIAVWED